MQTKLNPYLGFRDNAREAMEFYKTVFGGRLDLQAFGAANASSDPSEADKIMHAVLEADNGITFMAADTPKGMEHQPGTNISMALSGDNEEELRDYYAKLKEGGTERMPLAKAPWGDTFGMVTDKFGVQWMINISPKA